MTRLAYAPDPAPEERLAYETELLEALQEGAQTARWSLRHLRLVEAELRGVYPDTEIYVAVHGAPLSKPMELLFPVWRSADTQLVRDGETWRWTPLFFADNLQDILFEMALTW